jgi:uncharacterized cupin superfamily protein
VHEREHEMFYVLEGMIDVYVGDECFRAAAGECAFLPKRKAHAFKIQSSEVHPPDDGITYATVDLGETIKVFAKYGVRFLAPDEIALELPAFPLRPRELRTK